MGRKMSKLDNSNKLFLHTLGNQVGRAKFKEIEILKKIDLLTLLKVLKNDY